MTILCQLVQRLSIARDEREACTLRLTLQVQSLAQSMCAKLPQAIRRFLEDPFSAWKLPSDKLPEKFHRALEVHRKINAERREAIRRRRSACHAVRMAAEVSAQGAAPGAIWGEGEGGMAGS